MFVVEIVVIELVVLAAMVVAVMGVEVELALLAESQSLVALRRGLT